MPSFCANRPCCQWTVAIATTITATIIAGPSGPSRPNAVATEPAEQFLGAVRRHQ
jgi:hypothetical protein